MIELLIQYITFASQGLQEFCIACVPIWVGGMLTRPLSKQPKNYVAAPGRKQAARGAKLKTKGRTKAKPRTAPKAKKQAEKPWFVAPPLTPHQQVIHDKYRAKYWGEKVDDSWGGYGIPL